MQIHVLKKGERRPRVGRQWSSESAPVRFEDILNTNADYAALVDANGTLRAVVRWSDIQHTTRLVVLDVLLRLLCGFAQKDKIADDVHALRSILFRYLVNGTLSKRAVQHLLDDEGQRLASQLALPFEEAALVASTWPAVRAALVENNPIPRCRFGMCRSSRDTRREKSRKWKRRWAAQTR